MFFLKELKRGRLFRDKAVMISTGHLFMVQNKDLPENGQKPTSNAKVRCNVKLSKDSMTFSPLYWETAISTKCYVTENNVSLY